MKFVIVEECKVGFDHAGNQTAGMVGENDDEAVFFVAPNVPALAQFLASKFSSVEMSGVRCVPNLEYSYIEAMRQQAGKEYLPCA